LNSFNGTISQNGTDYSIHNLLIRSQKERVNTSILTCFPVIIRILYHFFVVIYGSLRVIPQRVADFVAEFVIDYHQGVLLFADLMYHKTK